MSFTHTAGYRSKSLLKAQTTPAPEAPEHSSEPSSEHTSDTGSCRSDAWSDMSFVDLVAEADRHRDEGEWRKAEEAYAAALALHPRQSGYWVQHGHMCKEQGRFADAEISYRSGAALGAEARDVVEHVRFVMGRQGASEGRFPIRFAQPGSAAEQVPTQADIRLLARLLWRVGVPSTKDMLKLLRDNATCDDAFAAMVADTRFQQANINWLALVEDGDLRS